MLVLVGIIIKITVLRINPEEMIRNETMEMPLVIVEVWVRDVSAVKRIICYSRVVIFVFDSPIYMYSFSFSLFLYPNKQTNKYGLTASFHYHLPCVLVTTSLLSVITVTIHSNYHIHPSLNPTTTKNTFHKINTSYSISPQQQSIEFLSLSKLYMYQNWFDSVLVSSKTMNGKDVTTSTAKNSANFGNQ